MTFIILSYTPTHNKNNYILCDCKVFNIARKPNIVISPGFFGVRAYFHFPLKVIFDINFLGFSLQIEILQGNGKEQGLCCLAHAGFS